MRLVALLVASLLALLPARAEQVVADLSRDQVAITATFDGSDILVYGAVKREAPIAPEPPLEVIVTVQGPSEPVTVRRKDRRFGIWVNTDAVSVDAAPSFYAVATTGPIAQTLRRTDDLRHKISVTQRIRLVGEQTENRDVADFSAALRRIRELDGLYQLSEGSVKLFDDTLFSASFDLPANLVEGDYRTRIFLTRGGRVIDNHETVLEVRKVGLERWIFNLAHDRPLIYGLLSLAIAIFAGWAASSIFRFLRF